MANFTFRHDVSDSPECEDDMYVLLKDGVDTNIAIQDARSYGGGYALNQYLMKDGHVHAMKCIGDFRSLKKAKEAALAIA